MMKSRPHPASRSWAALRATVLSRKLSSLYGRSCSFFWWMVVWELMMGAERFLMACRVIIRIDVPVKRFLLFSPSAMSGICCLHRCSRILVLRCPFCENTKKATKNPTARPTKGTRRATVPPKPPLKAHMHIVTHLVHLQPRAIIRQIVRQCTWEFRLPTSRDEKKRRYPEMNQSSNVRARRGSV